MSFSLKILGNMGGIGEGFYTTAALLDESVLVDAGTGVNLLSEAQLRKIRNVLLTHSHLDHVAMLPLLLDVKCTQGEAVTVHCLQETADAVRDGLLNDRIWPNMEKIHVQCDRPAVSFEIIKPYETFRVDGIRFTPLPVHHQVPTVGFCLHGESENFVFIADACGGDESLWRYLKNLPNFRRLVMEISYPNDMEELARKSHHLTAKQLHDLLSAHIDKSAEDLEIFYCHAKPAFLDTIAREAREFFGGQIKPLKRGDVFTIF